MMTPFCRKYALPIGMLCLSAGILLNQFFNQNEKLDVLVGFLIGISIALNIFGAIQRIRNRKLTHE